MTRLDENVEVLGWLQSADESELGICLTFESPEAMRLYRARLYKIRKEFGGYAHLSFVDNGAELWIVKRSLASEQG